MPFMRLHSLQTGLQEAFFVPRNAEELGHRTQQSTVNSHHTAQARGFAIFHLAFAGFSSPRVLSARHSVRNSSTLVTTDTNKQQLDIQMLRKIRQISSEQGLKWNSIFNGNHVFMGSWKRK
jgi:hypothetical protein